MTNIQIEKKSYSEQIFDYFFNEIKEKRLKSGDKLPNERQLSALLGVSRPSLREALKSLSQIGLLSQKQGGGTFVENYDTEFIRSILKYLLLINEELAFDLIQVRKALEAEAARLAAKNATIEDIQKLQELFNEREAIFTTIDESDLATSNKYHELDFKFHMAIAAASKNNVFMEFISSIRKVLSIHQSTANQPYLANTFHKKILLAIKNHDPENASKIMYEHIQSIESAIKNSAV